MFRSVVIGSLVAGAIVIGVGVLMGLTVVPDDPGHSFAQQHNILIRETLIQTIIVVGWILALATGGFVAARRDRKRWLLASFLVGATLLILWGVPTAVIAATRLSVTHLVTVIILVPSALLGGVFARERKPSNPPLNTDAPPSGGAPVS
jgi:putative membrane protein (TIGR04086 family)